MAIRKEWLVAHEQICDKWRRLVDMSIADDPDEFLRQLKGPCAFREQATRDIASLGVPKPGVELKPQDFCHGCIDLGGCDPVAGVVEKAMAAGDLEAAHKAVYQHLVDLEALRLPDLDD